VNVDPEFLALPIVIPARLAFALRNELTKVSRRKNPCGRRLKSLGVPVSSPIDDMSDGPY
jgi:hypothetical protein